MKRAMTAVAQGDEVLFTIFPGLAPANKVMDLELISSATVLAFPSVSFQDFRSQLVVARSVEAETSFSNIVTHADRLIWFRNCCCCKAGRNPNNR
jgi:hypothetical protein